MRLKNKTSIVTGAGSGIGKSIAKEFAREGADVAIVDINGDITKEVVKDLKKFDQKSLAIEADVTKSEEIDEAVKSTHQKFGKIDMLVNSAGVNLVKSVQKIEENEWDRLMETNLKGIFLFTKRVVSNMIDSGNGKIINISSSFSRMGIPGRSAYCASKGGVVSLTQELGLELAPFGINVNGIAPGEIKTNMTKPLLKNSNFKKDLLSMIPAGRVGKPDDIAPVAVFLASEESDYIVGETIFVDGGWSLRALPKRK